MDAFARGVLSRPSNAPSRANPCAPRTLRRLLASGFLNFPVARNNVARALATRPDVLVLDEPTAGVDREATAAVLEFISQIYKERKITVLLVTHDFSAVRHYAEKVIWLHEGKVFHGATDELLTPERMAEMFEMGVG